MRVALVHDYLNQYGGAERVLESLLDLFPDAHIYTLLYSPERTSARFRRNVRRTSFLDVPLARRRHRPFIPLMPAAVRSLKIPDEYDLVLSDSAGYAKGVPLAGNPFHLSYCYTPLRYAWELDNYFNNPAFKTVFRPVFQYLKRWDLRAAQKPDAFLAVSRFIAEKIRIHYHRPAEVLYPPVDYGRFHFERGLQPFPGARSYYLAVGRLMHYKKFSLLVEAFRELGRELWIAGAGPEWTCLQRLAGSAKNIRFLHSVSDRDLSALYNGAQALLFPQVEDFGLVAAEAQACGAPVIAYARGGALEIVQDGRTGLLFHEQTAAGLAGAVRRFEGMEFDRAAISRSSRRFTAEAFHQGIGNALPPELRELGDDSRWSSRQAVHG
jgi:glycosyltransferase involved in cell wall biosynthesis